MVRVEVNGRYQPILCWVSEVEEWEAICRKVTKSNSSGNEAFNSQTIVVRNEATPSRGSKQESGKYRGSCNLMQWRGWETMRFENSNSIKRSGIGPQEWEIVCEVDLDRGESGTLDNIASQFHGKTWSELRLPFHRGSKVAWTRAYDTAWQCYIEAQTKDPYPKITDSVAMFKEIVVKGRQECSLWGSYRQNKPIRICSAFYRKPMQLTKQN